MICSREASTYMYAYIILRLRECAYGRVEIDDGDDSDNDDDTDDDGDCDDFDDDDDNRRESYPSQYPYEGRKGGMNE